VGDSAELARHAAGLPVDAVAMVAPSFHRPRSVEDLVEFVVAAAEPAEKPVWLYHIPALSGVHLDAVEVCEGLRARCSEFAGVKFTVSDLLSLQTMLVAASGRWQVAWGCDELMLPALAMGAELFVGSTYNYAAPTYLRLIEAFERGDVEAARRASRLIPPLLEVLGRFGPIHAGKRLVGRWGVELGGARLPERPLSGEQLVELDAAIASLELMAEASGA
jgi:N-acetylneuraminate lyase